MNMQICSDVAYAGADRMEEVMSSRFKMIIKTVGAISTNCCILINNETKEAVIVDPGDNEPVISSVLLEESAKPSAILLTHAHFDHMLAAGALRDKYGIPVYMSAAETALAESPDLNLSGEFGCTCSLQADRTVNDGDKLELAGFILEVIATPGHTAGSLCYYIADENVLISGDTLFHESMGRTDFPTGSLKQIIVSIQDKLMKLPDETNVYPGHGQMTQIGWERLNNPVMVY